VADEPPEDADMTETTDPQPSSTRLLPWDAEGKPAILITDPGGTSPMARLADRVEASQLLSAQEVLRLSGLPEAAMATTEELRWVVARLRESLTETLRVAESRGMRLPAPVD
jgi:hypothetical protein